MNENPSGFDNYYLKYIHTDGGLVWLAAANRAMMAECAMRAQGRLEGWGWNDLVGWDSWKADMGLRGEPLRDSDFEP